MKMFPAYFAVFVVIAVTLSAEEAPKHVDSIHFSKIIPLLPSVPAGWTAPDPDGSTLNSGGIKMTTVGRTYTKGDGDNAPTVSFNIIDYANNKQFFDATTAAWSISQETTDGYMKPVKIDGNNGFEVYDNNGKTGQLWVVAAGRFFVHIETANLEPSELQVWMKLMDFKKLAALK